MDIDKPLEEIIAASKPKARRGGRPARGAPTGARDRYASNVPRAAAVAPQRIAGTDAVKIIISNLPMDVTEAAIRDLMQSTVGPVRTVQMSYTATGKSTGQATIVFRNRGDANKAHASYNNRMIDNQRPMKVEIALDINNGQSLASRVAPVQARGQAPRPDEDC
ncbi:uncharacterized protein MKK02DRAFT_43343 [Dioszegia hungarica]|uniref:RRM domain-containing protein n=1 Tax=Dioszegia hungarica TaxID=4972 RepID=A0AA38HEB1_9TREE|nr:uncharacterized protein MKK02DRAFT_43343 [Dioszegia hungarica]KAI9637421.1 hypothetical protein MKK02DRAFT_43343 [Dioszegia hungarica]